MSLDANIRKEIVGLPELTSRKALATGRENVVALNALEVGARVASVEGGEHGEDVASTRVFMAEEIVLNARVAGPIEELYASGEAVATSSTGLLVVTLEAVGNFVVEDEAGVGFAMPIPKALVATMTR
jgi:hypothetical protein